ncbi:U3 small nucleolar RNA-associated protein [Malassezia cuniculi]|uniref:U3 small nucleolar RNA-associated protein n=1 Tax=Malassezia cuniculi TaxID=948313 RepID=A0AAF0J6X5_9BASI|nr:U3 small nucleolar RNA-associated protein [Malassezia cuniculi]
MSSAAPGPAVPLHRVRFVDWTPSSITALAFSPVPPRADGAGHVSAASRSMLAIGRENGNIDLCTWCEAYAEGSRGELAKGWVVERTLLGDVNYKIEALAFSIGSAPGHSQVLRLFSTSGGSIITEHFLPPGLAHISEAHSWARASDTDLVHDAPTRTLSSHGGAVWSIAASPLGRFLAIGCEDGYVRLIDIRGDAFEHAGYSTVPRLARVGNRIMSLAWGPPKRVSSPSSDDSSSEDDEDEWAESFLFGGLGNSSAAVWDIATGHVQARLSVLKNRSEHTIVWAVAVLGDGTLVAGDSTGRVTFFDARSRVPIPGATFQSHTSGADVLALCVGSDGRAVYSAGVDQKVVEYTLIAQQWAHTGTRRLHAHDIRALAIDPPFDMAAAVRSSGAPTVPRLPVLVSGGIDFTVVMTPAAPAAQYYWRNRDIDTPHGNPISSTQATAFADTTQRRIPFVPQSARTGIAGGGVVSVCPQRRWLVLRRDTSVAIWHVEEQWSKVIELELRVRSNLAAVAVSADGRFLAVSDAYESKVFELVERDDAIVPRKVELGGLESAPGVSALAFTPDSRRLILCTLHGAYVHVLQLHAGSPAQVLRTFGQHRVRTTDAPDGRVRAGDARIRGKQADPREVYVPVVIAAVSPDGQWLFTADSARRMHTFNLDSLTHQRVLPSPASVPASVSFHPQRPSVLAVAMPTNEVYLYDLDAEGDGDAAAEAERTLRPELERVIGRFREPLVGSAWLSRGDETVLVLYGPTWLCTARATGLAPAPKKRGGARDDSRSAWVVRATSKYQPLLYAGVLGNELLVVERPYVALTQGLPPAFYRGAKYGF